MSTIIWLHDNWHSIGHFGRFSYEYILTVIYVILILKCLKLVFQKKWLMVWFLLFNT